MEKRYLFLVALASIVVSVASRPGWHGPWDHEWYGQYYEHPDHSDPDTGDHQHYWHHTGLHHYGHQGQHVRHHRIIHYAEHTGDGIGFDNDDDCGHRYGHHGGGAGAWYPN